MPVVKFLLTYALLFYFSCALLTAALMVLVTGVISLYELVEKGVQTRGVVIEPPGRLGVVIGGMDSGASRCPRIDR